jgi:SAM-dependent methyltransferase
VVVSGPRQWDGGDYQARFDALAAEGVDVHGEVRFVLAYSPASVLDAGCGTGRVALELARRGVDAVGVDVDPSMLATARSRGPQLRFEQADLADVGFDLGRTFDVVVMAGNVVLFTPPGTQGAVVAGCARHLDAGGLLVAGFQLDRGYDLDAYDRHCSAAGLTLVERWSTWDRDPHPDADPPSYAVSVHRLR